MRRHVENTKTRWSWSRCRNPPTCFHLFSPHVCVCVTVPGSRSKDEAIGEPPQEAIPVSYEAWIRPIISNILTKKKTLDFRIS
ncbi:unnamed protein product [Ixodes pacificus]